jgi:hypothetical protein
MRREATMAGILAIWNDFAPEALELFEKWYNREHLQERVGVPGFRFGRRYERVTGGDRRFFAFYEVDSPAVLTSPAYVERLNSPTPWTSEVMLSFRGMVRTVCELRATAGDLIGSHAVVLRADEEMQPSADAEAFVRAMAERAGVARVQLWTAAAQQTRADTAEMKRRGKDQLIAGAFVVECVRREDAERVARELGKELPAVLGISGASVLGVYGLLCIYTKR